MRMNGVLAGITLLAGAWSSARASSISFLDQYKNIGFLQTGNGNSLTGNGTFYSSDLNATVLNPYTSVTMTYPGPGSPVNLTAVPASNPTYYHYQTPSFANRAAMDAAFPFGTYTFQGVSGMTTDTANYAYTADDYALSNPYLTGTDYTSLQGMNPSQGFTFHLSPFTTGSNASFSYIFLTVYDLTSNMFVFNQGFLPPTTTTIFMPGNTLTYGHMYIYDLDYSNRDLVPSPGAMFPAQLGFELRTDGTFSTAAAPVPEPSTAFSLLIGQAFLFCALRLTKRASP